MRRRIFLTTLATITLLSALSPSTSAQNHLEPEDGILNADGDDWVYAKKVRTLLLKDGAFYYAARMICLPSFQPEWMVTVTVAEDEDVPITNGQLAYIVEYVGAVESLWDKKKWRDTTVKRARANLDKATAEVIHEVWRQMLRTVRYPEKERNVLDGATYHFSRAVALMPNAHGGFERGQIDTPPSDSSAGELAAIGDRLREYTLAKPEERDKIRTEIRDRADQLRTKLERTRQPE